MVKMSFRYSNNSIIDEISKNRYDCKDKTDMEILCNNINILFSELELKCKHNELKLEAIRRFIE